jgi:hypothetical protein
MYLVNIVGRSSLLALDDMYTQQRLCTEPLHSERVTLFHDGFSSSDE